MAEIWTHPDYEACSTEWSRARDVLAGEDAVKGAGERYLPRLDSQSEEEYAAYKARASFFGATARTLEEYLDLVFRRAPVLALGVGEQLKAFVADCDLWGLDFQRYARRVVGEVLAVGRAGSLVLEDGASGRPWIACWRAEDVLSWSVELVRQRSVLTRVVLKDGERVREFRLSSSQCVEEVWRQVDGAWCVEERNTLKRDGVALSFVPFVFHGARSCLPERTKLPLADIIAANLDRPWGSVSTNNKFPMY